MVKGGFNMKQIDKVIDFREKLSFQGYEVSPIKIQSKECIIEVNPFTSWINVRGLPIMLVKNVLKLVGEDQNLSFSSEAVRRNNVSFLKHKAKRKWKNSQTASFQEEVHLLRYLKRFPEPYVAVNLNIQIESQSLLEQSEDLKFIQGKLLAARVSSVLVQARRDNRVMLTFKVNRKTEVIG